MTRESRFLKFSMATLERANLGGANMRIMRGGHSWQLGSIASLARETTGGEILVAVWPKHGLRSDFRVPNLKNFPGGACPHTPLVSFPDRIFRARRKNGSGQLPIPFSFKCAGMLAHCSFLI